MNGALLGIIAALQFMRYLWISWILDIYIYNYTVIHILSLSEVFRLRVRFGFPPKLCVAVCNPRERAVLHVRRDSRQYSLLLVLHPAKWFVLGNLLGIGVLVW